MHAYDSIYVCIFWGGMNVRNYIRRCEQSVKSPPFLLPCSVAYLDVPSRLQHHPPGAVLCLRSASCSTRFNSCGREKKQGYRPDTEPEG